MAKEKIFEVTNEEGTKIKSMEGSAKVSYKYEDSEDFEEVLDEEISKGEVRAEGGRFPVKDEGRVFRESKIEVIPTNYPFYLSRVSTKEGDPKTLLANGKFKLVSGPKKSRAELKTLLVEAKATKAAALLEKLGG